MSLNIIIADGQAARAVGERGSVRGPLPPRSHHNWGARFGRRRSELKDREPTTLAEIEQLAWRSAQLMEKHGGKSNNHFYKAVDLLRQQYNMNFVMVCDRCNGSHFYDEVTAPERFLYQYPPTNYVLL